MFLYYLSGFLFLFISLFMMFLGLMMLMFKFSLFIQWDIYSFNSLNLVMYIYIDWMTLIFIFTVMLISSMIMFYCVEYMSHDLNFKRFFFLVFLFILSMIFMIISPNCMSILLGWDGLGLISYCLVIFYQNYYSYNCGMLTVLLNRIGDVMIIISLTIMSIFGSWNFLNFNNMYMLVLFLIIISSFTKSAQFPFSSWLPAAMAAPTPVSSLVHSSTLVTAGVYLLIRFNYMIYKMEYLLFYILLIGLITMLMAGLSAIFEFDMKKIIAFSTLSQLGLMMMIYSMMFLNLCFFHLIIHAMFKSMMFMCSGVIIHSVNGYQDIRFLGKIFEFMPVTSMMLMISNFSLCGLPFMSGFFSKDMILEMMFMSKLNFFIYFLLIFATFLTVTYSIRLMYYLMKKNFNFFSYLKICDFKIMNYSMIILMFMSIIFGLMLNWFIFSNIEYIFLINYEKNLILFMCLFSLVFSLYILNKFIFKKKLFLYYFFGKMYFLYNLNNLFLFFFLFFGKFYMMIFDKGWSEMLFKNYFIYYLSLLNFKLNYNFLIFNMLIMMFFIILMIMFI
uniref:NADH-ubiquinone oxidoreductase chain 5 n=1 Tax=Encarsia obtusiclava TaxID=2358487 RepID=A0A386T9W5_9HYME|nr:NADH dehydrogenase subunit 5 [Encarsia obtusiclava]